MCLVFVAYNCTSSHRFVIAANRDEYRSRSTAPLGYIDTEQTILGGRDLQAGGMWLGVTKSGKIAAITNFRDGVIAQPEQPSRGDIVYDYLRGNDSAIYAMEGLSKKSHKYGGFNVLFGDDSELVYFSNRQNEVRILKPGFYGLCNHLLDTPWPKVTRGKELLKDEMCREGGVDAGRITHVLTDDEVPADNLLPETGIGLTFERFLSPIFIDGPDYGTRSSAVVEVGHKGDVFFTEISYIHGPDSSSVSSQLEMGFGK
ncbi:NRDE family protein [Desulforhopalus sp. 52FAK]